MAQPSKAGWARVWGLLTHDRSIGFGLEHLGYLTLRFPRVMALVVLATTLVTASQIPRANVDGDLLRVYAESGKEYEAYRHLADTFGTFEQDVYLLVTSKRLTDPAVLERTREFALELSLSEYAAGTLSPFALRKPDGNGGSEPAVPEGLTDPIAIAAALSDLQQNDPMMRNLINPDLSGVVMILFPDPELSRGHTAEMIASLRQMVAAFEGDDLHIELTGPPIWTAEMLGAAVNDQIKFTIYGFCLGALIAFVALRSFWAALLVSATPFVAVVWTMGTILLLFGSFSFLTIIVSTLVLVIAFAESLFFMFNWQAHWRDGMPPARAVDATIRHMGAASGLTMLTTLISFASLSLTPGRGIGEFSIAGALGSALLFVSLMTFLPLLLKTMLRLGVRLPQRPSFVLTAPVPVAWFLATRFGRSIALIGILLTALFFIPYFLIQPRFSIENVMARGSTALTAAQNIDAGVGGVSPLYVRVPLREGIEDVGDADFLRIQAVHEILEKHLGENKVISAAAFAHYAESGFSREEIFDAVGPFLRRRFVTEDGAQALVTGFMPTIIESDDLEALVANVKADLAAAAINDAEIGGFRIMTTFATDRIVRGLQFDLTASVVFNIFLIGLAFMSLRVVLASAIPNLFPILGTEAWLWWTGSGLQLTSVIALTIAFGIAVDDTVHFLSHYLQERRELGRSHLEAVKQTMQRLGGAIVATTLILCSGMAIVLFSELPLVAMFGQLFVSALAFALLGDLFILPALLVAGQKFFQPLAGIRMADAATAAEAPSKDDDPAIGAGQPKPAE
jgi:predicted RND superfamily exporter protein